MDGNIVEKVMILASRQSLTLATSSPLGYLHVVSCEPAGEDWLLTSSGCSWWGPAYSLVASVQAGDDACTHACRNTNVAQA